MLVFQHVGTVVPGPVTPTSDNAPWQARVEDVQGAVDSPNSGSERPSPQPPRSLTSSMAACVDEVLDAVEAHCIGQTTHRAAHALSQLDRALLHGGNVVHPLNQLRDIVDEARDFWRSTCWRQVRAHRADGGHAHE